MAIFGTVAAREAELRKQAVADADALFREHGASAVRRLTERLIDTGVAAEERRLLRLTRLEVERLMRIQQRSTTALVIYRPKRFTMTGLAKLLGFGRKRSGRRR